MSIKNRENEHEDVYGKSFALYNAEHMKEFVGFFEQRVALNGLDAKKLFAGKKCVDAGAGNGRGALMMLKNGAASVTALDISEENLRSVDRNLKSFGFTNFICRQSSLEHIDDPDESYDFVWCNGVLMHTANPDACLRELARVLKTGGQSWIYVYGSNGFYWYLINHFRSWFKELSASDVLDHLQLMGVEVRYIGEYMDDWKVPYLRSYTDADFSTRLKQVGFNDLTRLWRGVSYDTCERLVRFAADAPWLGEGDLRYLLTKTRQEDDPAGTPLSATEFGSVPNFAPEIEQAFGLRLTVLKQAIGSNLALGLMAAASLQRQLRDVMTRDEAFDVLHFQSVIDETTKAVAVLASAGRVAGNK